MHISENTRDRLVLWDRHVFTTILFGAAAVTLIIAPFVRASEIGPIARLLLPLLGLLFVWAIVTKMPVQRYLFDRVAQRLVRGYPRRQLQIRRLR